MTPGLNRTPVSLEDLKEEDLIVAYWDDADLQSDDAALNGAILLRHANPKHGSWNVTYRDGRREAPELINLSNYEHIFRVWAGARSIGHRGPWA
ncbi:hypothetical protein [Agreia sp. COWG]|uniref:hypothetical protein n=1 Tax=Agreia sp. COWG TaxID=2773266 RepID=UPI0019266BCC|nr:hypothetical protein [Agreia sp. COWG]CAD6016243.1 protein of unknown function [Agreia sp. COWG]